MITVPRAESYAEATIKSFREGTDEPLWLLIGCSDRDYLKDHRDRVPATPKEQDLLNQHNLRFKAVWNYIRALNFSNGNTMVLEDDIVFSKGWRKHLDLCIKAAEQKTDKYIMTLYVPDTNECGDFQYTFALDEWKKGNYIGRFPDGCMYGTQAMYFPSSILQECRDFFETKLDLAPHDWIIRDFCAINNYPIFCTAPTLVQHVGVKTTGLAGKHHISQCFVEDVSLPISR